MPAGGRDCGHMARLPRTRIPVEAIVSSSPPIRSFSAPKVAGPERKSDRISYEGRRILRAARNERSNVHEADAADYAKRDQDIHSANSEGVEVGLRRSRSPSGFGQRPGFQADGRQRDRVSVARDNCVGSYSLTPTREPTNARSSAFGCARNTLPLAAINPASHPFTRAVFCRASLKLSRPDFNATVTFRPPQASTSS